MNDPKLLYCTKTDGYSLGNLYNKAKGYQNYPMIILIKTNTNIFGAYCNEMLHFSKIYYGNNDTFVFILTPEYQKFDVEESQYVKQDHVLSLENYLQFGEGCDKPAFKIDSELYQGKTFCNKVYNNQLLNGTHDKNEFQIEALEIFALM